MSHDVLEKQIQFFMNSLGIHTKEIKIIVDPDVHITLLSIRLSGTDEELFTQNYNELSRDLGLVFKLYIQKQFNFYKDLVVDINGRNQKLINHTKEKAQIAVDRVLFFDKPYEFGYLNAYERMLIHTYLKKFPELSSESKGEGRDRRLVLRKRT